MYIRVLYSLSGLLRTCKEPQLASLAGVEPATCRLGGGCSILLSYRDISCLSLRARSITRQPNQGQLSC